MTREAGEQSRSSPKANPSHELTRARSGPSRARSHLPQEIDLGHCCQMQLARGSEVIPHPAVPAVVLTEETIMASSFANNRTLADIYLYARHLLFIFSSSFLHVLCPMRGHGGFANARAAVCGSFGPCSSWPAGVGSACTAGGQMFDAVDPAGARRPGSPRLAICQPM